MQEVAARRFRLPPIFAFCLLAAVVLAFGAYNTASYAAQYRRQVAEQLALVAHLQIDQLVQFRKDRLSDASFFQDNREFMGLAARILREGPGADAAAESLRAWLFGFQRMSRYDRIALVDPSFTIRLSVPESPDPIAEDLRTSIRSVLASGQVLFGDLYRNGYTGRAYFSTLVPIVDALAPGRQVGVLILRNAPESFLYPYLSEWPAVSGSSETLLVRREGDSVLFLNPLRFDTDAALRRSIPFQGQGDMPALMAVAGRTGYVEGRDYRGVPVVADVGAVPDSPWYLVAKMDRSEAFQPVAERVLYMGLFYALLVAATGSVLTLFLRRREQGFRREREKAAEALLESERRFRTLFEALTEGVALHRMIRDGEGRAVDYAFVTVNNAFFSNIGREPSPVEGVRATAFYGTKEAPYLDLYEKVVRTGEPAVFETYFPPLDRHFRVSIVSPKPGHFATIFEDVTEAIRREAELRERNEELARFTYMVSHDLKSPLVTVRTFLGYLEEDIESGDAERRSRDAAFIRGAAEKMNLLLDELLEFSRVGRKRDAAADTPLSDVVDEALSLTAGRIAARGVRVELPEARAVLHGERRRLVEVYENLLDNAVKFMGGQPDPVIRIGVEPGDPPVLSVADNGAGIDPRHHGKLFGLFEKLDPGSPGTGMGLALVRRIVETHGGKVWAESAGLGLGATFRFTLPGTRIEEPREERAV